MKNGYSRFTLGLLIIFVFSTFGMIINKQVTEDKNVAKYLNDTSKIEYLYSKKSYCISEKFEISGEIKIDTSNYSTSHFYKLIDTSDNNFINLDIRLNKNKCYIVSHLERNVSNVLINSNLKYTIVIQDSLVVQMLKDKHQPLLNLTKK